MQTPIYAEIIDEELEKSLERIGELLRAVEKEALFMKSKCPKIVATNPPKGDVLTVGRITVCGVSVLEDKEVRELELHLKGVTNTGKIYSGELPQKTVNLILAQDFTPEGLIKKMGSSMLLGSLCESLLPIQLSHLRKMADILGVSVDDIIDTVDIYKKED